MKLLASGTFTLLLSTQFVFAQQLPLKTGDYTARLMLSQTTSLPVRMKIETVDKQPVLAIYNADERIELKVAEKIGDTLVLPFPNFDSELRVVASKKRRLKGFWVNRNKVNYRIPFEAQLAVHAHPVPPNARQQADLSGRWETWFSPETADREAAVGIFEQAGNTLTGTFLTETGDYRFLEGTVDGNTFYVSCFDGSHAFLLTGSLTDRTINGTFYSGKHYQTNWTAVANDSFELRDPDSLTFVEKTDELVQFTFRDIDGADFSYPNAAMKNKVVIIQIMGTWCPNCLDETKYYKELYEKYHAQGLEIISIGYEAPETFEEQAAKIRRLKERHNLGFTFLVGGKASKGKASDDFAMLNEVISFPTTIFIGRDGSVKRIHTGFNGPGTGKYYTEYVEKTNALIESLLAQ